MSHLRLSADVEIIELPDDRFVLRSDVARHRLAGAAARLLAVEVLPRLDGATPLATIAAAIAVDEAELVRVLEPLVEAGIVVRSGGAMWERFGISGDDARTRLRETRIAVLGLEGPGAHAAVALAQLGVGSLTLLDPDPMLDGHRALMPACGPAQVGRPRQEVVRDAIAALGSATTVTLAGRELTRDAVGAVIAGVDAAIAAFDKSMSAAMHWANRASIHHRKPAVYASVESTEARIGPVVLPLRTACFMCYRMRAVACEADHDEAMGYERALDRRRVGRMADRPLLPTLSGLAGAILAQEIVKLVVGIEAHSLAGRVAVYDGLRTTAEPHTVLRQPQCPVCRPPTPPSPADLDGEPRGIDLRASRSALVSPLTGIVRELSIVPKDATEPALPLVMRAELANQLYLTHGREEVSGCSGKGMTIEDAQASALGEAVERYSASFVDPDRLCRARRGELRGASMDPRDLVLYAPEQYGDLPYVPYADDVELGWIEARSLVTDEPVWVPAIAVHLGYEPAPHERLFAVNSSGLATGISLRRAVTGALEEVLERDAFVIAWLQRLPAPSWEAATHPDPAIRDLCAAYARRGVRIALHRLPTDHPASVFAACAIADEDRDGPAVVVGLGASVDAAAAARRAVLEVAQVRPALRRRMRTPESQQRIAALVADPHQVTNLEDHDLLYTAPAMRDAFAHWFDSPPDGAGWTAGTGDGDPLAPLLAWFRDQQRDVLYVDLTSADMRELGLYTARVIVPGFQPIDFGWKERRLGGTRLYERGRASGPGSVNDLPHPLS